MTNVQPLLSMRNLSVQYYTGSKSGDGRGGISAVDDFCLDLCPGQTLAIIGQSGCGKTTAALSILRLLGPAARIISGRILFENSDILQLPEDRLRKIRGNRIAMIFEQPAASLNPVMTAGRQVMEAIMLHRSLKKSEAYDLALDILRQLGIPYPHRCLAAYPFQLSIGTCQRVMTAMALCHQPTLLIADEPTASLDLAGQAQLLAVLRRFRTQNNMAILLVTHDLAVAAETADHIAVMYAGRVIETGTAEKILNKPAHPYTKSLLDSLNALGKKQKIQIESDTKNP